MSWAGDLAWACPSDATGGCAVAMPDHRGDADFPDFPTRMPDAPYYGGVDDSDDDDFGADTGYVDGGGCGLPTPPVVVSPPMPATMAPIPPGTRMPGTWARTMTPTMKPTGAPTMTPTAAPDDDEASAPREPVRPPFAPTDAPTSAPSRGGMQSGMAAGAGAAATAATVAVATAAATAAATPVAVATAAAAGVAAATGSAAPAKKPKRNLAVPIVGAVGGSAAAVAAAWLVRWALGARRRAAWAIVTIVGVRVAMLAYAAQLSSVVHVTTQAVAYGGSVTVPKTYWIPYGGFAAAKGVKSTFRAPATKTKRMVGAQVGFAAQFVYMVAMGFAIFGPGWGVLALTAIGFLAYMFAYPWATPTWGNNFRWWA